MTRDEHKQIIQTMLGYVNSEHQAEASELLTNLSEDYEKTLTESETLTSSNETLKANNEKLRQVNADLFLKVGTSSPKPKSADDNINNDIDDSLSFEKLFNEKGELI